MPALKAELRPRSTRERRQFLLCSPLATREFEFIDEAFVFEPHRRKRIADHPFDPVLFLLPLHDAAQRDYSLLAGHHQSSWITDQGVGSNGALCLCDQLLIIIFDAFGTEQLREETHWNPPLLTSTDRQVRFPRWLCSLSEWVGQD